jgi:hypothetical protein
MRDPVIIDSFMIPEDMAKELSELLIKQSVRENLLLKLIDNSDQYETMEQSLIPIASKIEAIKMKITQSCVPAKYQSKEYSWNYNGYEISGCEVQLMKV